MLQSLFGLSLHFISHSLVLGWLRGLRRDPGLAACLLGRIPGWHKCVVGASESLRVSASPTLPLLDKWVVAQVNSVGFHDACRSLSHCRWGRGDHVDI